MDDILRKNYGEYVRIKYVDVIDDNMDEYPNIEDYLKKAGTRILPLLVINGRIIRPGMGLNYMDIVEELEDMGISKQ